MSLENEIEFLRYINEQLGYIKQNLSDKEEIIAAFKVGRLDAFITQRIFELEETSGQGKPLC